tara:strand:- start:271 stop:804 length:534 start_codon:yes stop_codon:yes gene_type:complete
MWLCEVNGYEFSEAIVVKDINTVHASVSALQDAPVENEGLSIDEEFASINKIADIVDEEHPNLLKGEEEVIEVPVIAPQSDNPFPTEIQQYDSLTVAELRVMCKAQGLPVYGTKAEIILRLKHNDEGIIINLGDTDGPTEDVAPDAEPEAPTLEVAASNGEETDETRNSEEEPAAEE